MDAIFANKKSDLWIEKILMKKKWDVSYTAYFICTKNKSLYQDASFLGVSFFEYDNDNQSGRDSNIPIIPLAWCLDPFIMLGVFQSSELLAEPFVLEIPFCRFESMNW